MFIDEDLLEQVPWKGETIWWGVSKDYLERYANILTGLCIKPMERCFIETEFPWRRQCFRCYRPGRFRTWYRTPKSHGFRSKLSQDDPLATVIECSFCDKKLIEVKPAQDCRVCVEIFLNNEEDIDDAVALDVFSIEKFSH